MLNYGKKIHASRDKKKYSNSCVVRKTTTPPPFKLNGRSLRLAKWTILKSLSKNV